MPSFKELCLQTSYEGTRRELSRAFFAPVATVSHKCRLALPSLTREVLLPISNVVISQLRSGRNVQMLINGDCNSLLGSVERNTTTHVESCTAGVPPVPDPLTAAASSDESVDVPELTGRFELKVSAGQEVSIDRELMNCGMLGIFEDDTGGQVSFHLDLPEASNSVATNVIVAWSWGDPLSRVSKATKTFDLLWDSKASVNASVQLNKVVLARLYYLDQHQDHVTQTQAAFQLYEHQRYAVRAWIDNQCCGVFKMCTGSGKTISALECARTLAQKQFEITGKNPPVIVSVPTRVLADQWINEIKRFGFRSILAAYNTFEQWNQLLEPTLRAAVGTSPRVVVTTYRTFADLRFTTKIKRAADAGVEGLWIADEMHNLSSPRLRGAMREVERMFPYRLGLSATPEIEGDLAATEYLLTYFGGICASYELADGIRERVLCPYQYFPTPAYLAAKHGKRYLSLLREINEAKIGSSSLMNAYRESRDLIRTSGVQIAKFRDLIQGLMNSSTDMRHTLIYCPPGYGTTNRDVSDDIDTDADERRLIEEVISILREYGLTASSILGETPQDQRIEILNRFADGRLDTLCAIGCLDEGVDVPSIKRAIVLYSVDREKQFVQRRGRILRQPKGAQEKVAEIFDIVILPQGSDMPVTQAESLLSRELRRYRQFAKLALNRPDADLEITRALSVATHAEHASPKNSYV